MARSSRSGSHSPTADYEETLTSAATATVTGTVNMPPTGVPTISGTAQVGQTLRANTSGISDADGLTNVSYSYQWLADNNEIIGATSSTYTLRASDNGKVITVRATFTDDEGSEQTLTSAATAAVTGVQGTTVNTLATGTPTISGTAQVGQTLRANTSGISDADGLTNVSYSYQWLADNNEIIGATSSTYTLRASDNGKVITVRVTFTDDAGNDESLTSAATAAVTITVTDLGSVVSRYDADNDGSISKLELMAAIGDYLFPTDPGNPAVTRAEVLELIQTHLFG